VEAASLLLPRNWQVGRLAKARQGDLFNELRSTIKRCPWYQPGARTGSTSLS